MSIANSFVNSAGITVAQVRVLVVEADPESQRLLVQTLEADPRIRVLHATGEVHTALDFLRAQRPDVVLMGDGTSANDVFETTRRIMETQPLPIVLCVAAADSLVFRSLEAGAVACVEKPRAGIATTELAATVARLQQTVRLMAEVKVVRRWSGARHASAGTARVAPVLRSGTKVVGIGASTGGPLVLQTILAELPRDFDLPVLVVQHIARGFLAGMADWLGQTSGMKVQVAAAGFLPLAGHVYLAPDDFHMGVDASGRIQLSRTPPEVGLRPSVAYLFRSLADVHGPDAIGVLLTGMGKDGAAELKRMKDLGAVTIVQDRASSVVHGMPGEAIALGGATHVLAADRISAMLTTLTRKNSPKESA